MRAIKLLFLGIFGMILGMGLGCAGTTGVDLEKRSNQAIAVPLTGYSHADGATDWTGPNAPSHTTKGDLDVIGPVPPSVIEFVTDDYSAMIASVADVSMTGVELTMPDGTVLKIESFSTDRTSPINAFSAAFAQAWTDAVLAGMSAQEAQIAAMQAGFQAMIDVAGLMIP